MKLSIIIVNYNVRYFLQQCLQSVRRATAGLEAEVFVVDNNSSDGSTEMLRTLFPEVQLIANSENLGFSKANNQAIRKSRGEYVLLLNPDTVVEEETFRKVCGFMDRHQDAGGLGVHMIDGKGHFLPESKRGLPTPAVAFFKISGLSALFPKSKTFGRYHLGFLDEHETQEVDVLSGAFMLLRRSTLDKTGLLDEDYFMYGEDIDLSYRITKAGYKNYYYPGTRIIHYKGESTKKSSVNYVFVFYKAMVIFARKHFAPGGAALFAALINVAIWLRAGLSIISRFAGRLWLPLADGLLIYLGMIAIKNYWSINQQVALYPPFFMNVVVPVYILVWIAAAYLSGGYDRPVRISRMIRGLLTGTVVILVGYALLPEQLRFSRALILFGTAWASLSVTLTRLALHLTGWRKFRFADSIRKRLLVAGDADEAQRILSLMMVSGNTSTFVGFAAEKGDANGKEHPLASHYLGSPDALADMISMYEINEVIFCGKNHSSADIIAQMLKIGRPDVEIKIAPPESLFIIGSNSIHEKGDLYFVDVPSINNPVNKRNKRLFDVGMSLLLLLLSPVLFLFIDHKSGFFINIFRVLGGKISWVGRDPLKDRNFSGLKHGVLSPSMLAGAAGEDSHTRERLNILYAKDFNVTNDLKLVWANFRSLGQP
ncbi:MAG: glycosyltransferase [Bacteroidia bacterium]|nr:glycosyltransferase [Bacteroidia bacterium]